VAFALTFFLITLVIYQFCFISYKVFVIKLLKRIILIHKKLT